MSLTLIVLLSAAIIITLFYLAQGARWLYSLPERRRRVLQWEEDRLQFEAEQNKRLEAVRAKVLAAQPLLTGSDWRDPEGKVEFVDALYEGKMPQYLWFAVPEMSGLTPKDWEPICELFWGSKSTLGFGDVEFHNSHHPEVGKALRIRNPRQTAAEIVLQGNVCPLYQVGHSCIITGPTPEKPCVLLLSMYDKPELANAA